MPNWIPYPGEVVLFNPELGEFALTKHAWERFIERASRLKLISLSKGDNNYELQAQCLRQLANIFFKARQVKLRKDGIVRRCIHNDFKPALYLEYRVKEQKSKPRLRFIVEDRRTPEWEDINAKKEEDWPLIFTVEIPFL